MGSSQWHLAWYLGVMWTLALLYGEVVVFWLPTFSCKWPDFPVVRGNASVLDMGQPVKVALIADPQLADSTSFVKRPVRTPQGFKRFFSDLFMRRAFQLSVLGLSPDYVFVLGDLFHGGTELREEEWRDSLWRYQHVFDDRRILSPRRRADKTIIVQEVAGNRDVGYSHTLHTRPQVVERFALEFGTPSLEEEYGKELNSVVDVGGAQFFLVNSPALDGDNGTRSAWSFLSKAVKEEGPNSPPRVLLTHLPMFPSSDTTCRTPSAKQIETQDGLITYQPYLSQVSTDRILALLRPVHVFSGHQHVYCTSTHKSQKGELMETIVGTFNPLLGSGHPSVVLLSVLPAAAKGAARPDPPLASAVCFLPSQQQIRFGYSLLAMLSFVALLLWPSKGFATWCGAIVGQAKQLAGGLLASRSQKLKDDDDDVEMEMMFDAEGMMYLVPKAKITKPIRPAASSSDRRGSVHARNAVAKRQAASEIEEIDPFQAEEPGKDELPTHSRKQKLQRVSFWPSLVRRLLGAVGPLVVLLGVEMALFVGFVAKDWT